MAGKAALKAPYRVLALWLLSCFVANKREASYCGNVLKSIEKRWCPGADLNHRHTDFQSAALPTELPGRPGREPLPPAGGL